MSKVHKLGDSTKHVFFCPGCGYDHWFQTEGDGPHWTWNGDWERPTVSPSILVNGFSPEHRCHFHLKDGAIEYCDDCHHDLRGKTVPMLDYEA